MWPPKLHVIRSLAPRTGGKGSSLTCPLPSLVPLLSYNPPSWKIDDNCKRSLEGKLVIEFIEWFFVSKHTELEVLRDPDLAKNLIRKIPTALGGLQSQSLEGVIPNTFGELISLVSLDLSINSFTGEISKSLNALTYLKNFNIFINNLQRKFSSKSHVKTFFTQLFY